MFLNVLGVKRMFLNAVEEKYKQRKQNSTNFAPLFEKKMNKELSKMPNAINEWIALLPFSLTESEILPHFVHPIISAIPFPGPLKPLPLPSHLLSPFILKSLSLMEHL